MGPMSCKVKTSDFLLSWEATDTIQKLTYTICEQLNTRTAAKKEELIHWHYENPSFISYDKHLCICYSVFSEAVKPERGYEDEKNRWAKMKMFSWMITLYDTIYRNIFS